METIPKIKLPTPYKIHNKLTSLNKMGKEKILNFIGSTEVEAMFYLYLFKKYKSNCFLYDKNVLKQISGRRILGISIHIKTKYEPHEKKEIEDQLITLANVLINCIKKDTKIIIIPLQLVLTDGCHANVLIYRKNLNQIEHFEPHGKTYSRGIDTNTDRIILDWMKYFVSIINDILFTSKMQRIKLIESTDVCPYIDGLQNLESWSNLPKVAGVEPGGYCVAWSMFFTELCLKNPNIPSFELMNYIFNTLETMSVREKMDYLKSVIRGYSIFVNEKIDKYFSLFDESGLTIKKIQGFPRSKLLNFRNLLKYLVELEMNLATNPLYLEETLENIKQNLDKLNGKRQSIFMMNEVNEIIRLRDMKGIYEKYKKFKVSEPTESINSSIMKSIPKQKYIKKESVKLTKPCPEGKEINPKTGRCVKSKTQKVRKVKIQKAKIPKQNPEIKLNPVLESLKLNKSCPPGKEINPKTGRCIKIKTQKIKKIKIPKMKTPKILPNVVLKLEPPPLEPEPKVVLETVKIVPEIKLTKTCPPGKENNPKTNRCVKIKTQKVKKDKIMKTSKKIMEKLEQRPKTCPEGKEINPKTNRCVKIKTQKVKKDKKIMEKLEQTPKTCPEGKEINPKTNRCFKIKTQKVRKVKV